MFDVDRTVRPSQSRREKREDQYQWACLKRLQDDIPNVNVTQQELRGLQDKASGIQDLREKCPEYFVEQSVVSLVDAMATAYRNSRAVGPTGTVPPDCV